MSKNFKLAITLLACSLAIGYSCNTSNSPTEPNDENIPVGTVNKISFNNIIDGLGEDYALAIINPDGSGLTKVGEGMRTENFSWSPDGTRLIWENAAHSSNTGDEICWSYHDGSQLNQMSVYGFYPVFSTDNSLIAFVRPPEPYFLYVMNADGSNVRELTKHAGGDLKFINNNTTIEFKNYYSNYGMAPGRYSINLDGSNLQQLPEESAPGPPDGRRKRISPDGNKVLFWRGESRKNWDIYVINSDGTGEKLLTQNANDWEYPFASWSPDSKQIVFTAQNSLDIINADGSNRYKLIDFNGRYTEPIWSPR